MSTDAQRDNKNAPESGQHFTAPAHHFHEDLSRAFGNAAYEWSESDQDAINGRTANGFLQSNYQPDGQHMNSIPAISGRDFPASPLLDTDNNLHAHDFDDLFVPPVYVPLFPPEPILSPFTSSEERELQVPQGVVTMDQMTSATELFTNDEHLPRDNFYESFETEEQTFLQTLNETQPAVNPEAGSGILSSAVLSNSPSLPGVKTIPSPPESAGESSSSAHPPNSISPNGTSPRVRFRSRVRIGTGIRYNGDSKAGLSLADEDADASSSASSTISAPLRTFADDSDGLAYAHTIGGRLPGRAYHDRSGSASQSSEENNQLEVPFSQLLSSDAADGWLRRNHGGRIRGGRRIGGRLRGPGSAAAFGGNDVPHERTPLKAAARRRASYDEEEPDVERCVMSSEEDLMFGPWPGRLLNRYWWWWKIEGLVCFCCTDSESESETDE